MRPEARPLPAIPADTLRLFPHHDAADLDPLRAAPFLIGRLLEDGDGADLSWLAASVPEADLAAWLAQRGGRQLSARSLAFWRVVLGPRGKGDRPDEQAGPEQAVAGETGLEPAVAGDAGPAAEPGAGSEAGSSTAPAAASGTAAREAAGLWPL